MDKRFCNGTEHVLQWEGKVFYNKIEKVLQWNEKMFCNKTEKVLLSNGKCQKWVCNEMEMVYVVLQIK